MTVLVAAVLAGTATAVLVATPRVPAARLGALPTRAHHVARDDSKTSPAAAGFGVVLTGRGQSWPRRRPGGRVAGRRPPPGPAASGVAVLVLAAAVLGPAVTGLVAAGTAVALQWWARRQEEHRTAAERDGAVQACGALAAELRAGRSAPDALAAAAAAAVGPSRDALRAAAATARLGGDVAAALIAPAGDRRTAVAPVLRALAACWAVCSGTGTGVAAAVDRLEEGLRAESRQRQVLDAELAGPRATAGLLAVLPAVGLLLASGLGADPVHVLLHTPVGLVCLATGLGLDALGVVWTQRLVTRASKAG